jgi:peroxiredoxin
MRLGYMRQVVFVAILLSILAFADPAGAQDEAKSLSIGDAAPEWKDLPGVDGKKHSFAELKDKPVVVVIFTCNSCDVATDYEDRIISFAKKHAENVAVVAINVNTIAEDLMPKMEARAKEKKFPFLYLFDETQKIGKDYGAVFTPEFFVLNKERKVVFKGGMDDHSNPELVKKNYLEPAVEAALAGKKPALTETNAIGCQVRYVSERDRERARKRKKN